MRKKITIIGGGVAGLSAGIYGQLNGFHTEIFEMHSIPGGQCTAWERKGYRFDYCLHWLVGTAKGPLNQIWKETNIINSESVILDHDIHTVIKHEPGDEFIIYTSIDRWQEYLTNMAPEDAGSIRRMCNDMRKGALYHPPEEGTGFRYLLSNARAFFRMLPLFVLFVKYGRKSCAEYFKGLNFKSHRLSRSLNTLFGESDFSALAIIMMLGWFDQKNAGYIIGGSLPLVTRMVKKYTASGGKINTGKKVVRIVVENNIATGILLADGTIVKSDHVISASDGHSTIFNLLEGKYLTAKIRKAYETWPLFTPLVQVSFGVDMEVRSKYSAETIMAVGNRVGSTTLVNGYILMNYSFDPTMAPSGKSVIIMRFESPWDTWKEMNEIDYKNEKEKIKTDANRLLESNYPGISDHIEVVDVATPLTNVRYTRSWKGAYEGFLPSSRNITKTLDNTLPGLKNFYMAGQWLYPGGGIPPSVLSGKKAIRQICRGEKRKFTAG